MYLGDSVPAQDHYKEFGGDAAAYSAPANDLQGVKAYSGVDMEGLYTVGTVVLDYRGFRVTAQSIIPGERHLRAHPDGQTDSPTEKNLQKDTDRRRLR